MHLGTYSILALALPRSASVLPQIREEPGSTPLDASCGTEGRQAHSVPTWYVAGHLHERAVMPVSGTRICNLTRACLMHSARYYTPTQNTLFWLSKSIITGRRFRKRSG
jgi:hypothetical protein